MRVSQITKVMDKDDWIEITDEKAKFGENELYRGPVRGIKKDAPFNKCHVQALAAVHDEIFVLVNGSEVLS